MQSSTARKPVALSETQALAQDAAKSALRKVWLPQVVYDAIPYLYLVAGISALLATLYVEEWFWILPHSLLFSAACLHFSAYVFRRRRARPPRGDVKSG